MKLIHSSLFRSLVAIIIGALLIKFGQDSLRILVIAIPVLGAINQFVRLIVANRKAKIAIGYWLSPVAIMLTGLIILLRPELIDSDPLWVMGWMILVYGIIEGVISFKLYLIDRKIAAEEAALVSAEAATLIDESAE